MRQKDELSAGRVDRDWPHKIVLPADLGSPVLVVLIVNCVLAFVAMSPAYAKFFGTAYLLRKIQTMKAIQ